MHYSAGDSGAVHSTVKERWINRDPSLVQGMQTLGSYADRGRDALALQNYDELGRLMDLNFQMRRQLYGDDVVGAGNIAAVNLANDLGFAAKFTGSGGAILCLFRRNCLEW